LIAPPLLMLAEGRRPRARKAAKFRPKEIAVHMAVADLLRRLARPEWKWSHFPAGEHRDIRTAAKLKAMGVQRGWPDFILISPTGKLHALELKRVGQSLTPEQQCFQEWCDKQAVPHAVARTILDAMRFLSAWGALIFGPGGVA
jgi:VRR-NUC domain